MAGGEASPALERVGSLIILGWREWAALPGLGIAAVRAKLDTGARSSSLHVTRIETFHRDGQGWVSFSADYDRRDPSRIVEATVPVHDERMVRNSFGQEELRIVIRTPLVIETRKWEIDLTLTSRFDMRFRMLIGREALRGRVVVDPDRSWLAGRRRKRNVK